MLRRAALLLIALALLTAQQAALAHQVWHLGKQDSQPGQSQLCEQHHALATVAGALDCALPEALPIADRDGGISFVAQRCALAPRLTPTSRGPPETLS